MNFGQRFLLRCIMVLPGLIAVGLGTGQSADAQLHTPLAATTSYRGTVPPPTLSRPPQYYAASQTPPVQQVNGAYGAPLTPQQMFSGQEGVPAAPPVMTYQPAPAGATPTYRPLPGGYSLPEAAPQMGNMPYSDQSMPVWNYAQPQERVGIDVDYNDVYCASCADYTWTLLPKDLLWQSAVGGPREPRLASSIVHLEGTGWLWELEAGGRAGLLRYGSGKGQELEGWQVDVWGGAFPRLNFEQNLELDAVDFKVGVPLTWKRGPLQLKLEWYHISSHLGDEFLLRPENANYNRLDYLRDSFVLGIGYFLNPDSRVYAEADYAYNTNGGAEPWHFQAGFDYAPVCPTLNGKPVPFFAISGQIREEVNYSGGVNVVAGLQWRGDETQRTFRTGLHYYAGESLQLSFLGDYEEFIGWGMWLDF